MFVQGSPVSFFKLSSIFAAYLKVLCGMVGMKRFKFDVFSNDVTLANEMESTGIVGRVHISEVTAKFLSNEYVLEEAPDHAGWYLFILPLMHMEKVHCGFLCSKINFML